MGFTEIVHLGLSVALEPTNLFYCFLGVFIGTLVGVLPGIGPVGTMAILLPVTYGIHSTAAIIMLAGIYYGAMYGGSTTSILVNLPGEAASVVTCLDGYQMARQGRAGPALGISAFGSFIAATFSIIALQFIANPLASIALRFGPPEYFSVIVLAFVIITYLAQKSLVKALMMAALGGLLGTIGVDIITGIPRFTFDIPELFDGMGLIPVGMGLYGVAEVFVNAEKIIKQEIYKTHIKNLLPTLRDWKDSIWPILRGTVIGFFVGALPGPGASVASFTSYALEKRISKTPERFGKGTIEGVAGPEAANNSATVGSMVPLLTMGIPGSIATAMLLGALMIQGITPGPLLVKQHPDLLWGVVFSMYVGNMMLLFINLPLIGLWVRLVRIPYSLFFPFIVLICLIGVYSVRNTIVDLWLLMIFGVVGYFFRKFEYEPAPLILAYILSSIFDETMRQSLLLSNGSFSIFFIRPISLVCLIAAALILGGAYLKGYSPKSRKEVR